MNFLKIDEIRDLVLSLRKLSPEENDSDKYVSRNQYELIVLDMFVIHLSAGKENFSIPRDSIYDKLSNYSHLQVMIEERAKNNTKLAFVCPKDDSRFQKFKWAKYFSHSWKVYNRKQGVSYIGREVPFEEALQIIKDCHKMSGLKLFF